MYSCVCSAVHILICNPLARPHLLSQSIDGLLALLQLLVASIYRDSKLGIALHTAGAAPQDTARGSSHAG